MLRQGLDSCFRLPFLMKPDPRVAGTKRACLKPHTSSQMTALAPIRERRMLTYIKYITYINKFLKKNAEMGYNPMFFKMSYYWIKCLVFFLCLNLASFLAIAKPNDSNGQEGKAEVTVELGIDSLERKYYRPQLRFDIPLKFGLLFLESMYYQRINSKLQGEVDFWLRAGLMRNISDSVTFEASANHMCRHYFSRYYPDAYDFNELIGRFWLEKKRYILGFGLGTYFGGTADYKGLAVFNCQLPSILDSEFSLSAEIKLVNFDEIVYELEISAALDESADLFVRNTKHYEYRNTTYIGMRFKSGENGNSPVDYMRFGAGFYPFDDDYQAVVTKKVIFEFFKNTHTRALFTLDTVIPVLRSRVFLRRFKPEQIRHPLSVEYEKKATDNLFVYGYCEYDLVMPIDEDLEFESSLGIGAGLRNQYNFDLLIRKFRFEFYGGYNFTHNYDFGANIGYNTVQKPFNVGLEVHLRFNSEKSQNIFRFFCEFGNEVMIRPFVGVEQIVYFNSDKQSNHRFLFGVELFK
ncbi:MAG: hypothetical protein ACETWK_14135 [Candidatus Aminicenantaceae bacterium]